MKRISFTVFAIWIAGYLIGFYVFKYLPIENPVFFSTGGIVIDLKILFSFILQLIALGTYFTYFQKEQIKDAFLRAFVFNALIYFVYFLMVYRVQGV